MAGPTDLPTEDVKDLRESQKRLAGEVHEIRGELAGLRLEMAEKFGEFRTEMAGSLGAINGTLESLRTRLDHSVSVAKWTVGILMPIIVGLIGTAVWLTWHAAKLDSRVERLENAAHVERPTVKR